MRSISRGPVGRFKVEKSGKNNIDAAVEHKLWCAKNQSPGYIEIQTLKPNKSGGHVPFESHWFHNRDPDLGGKLHAVLSRIKGNELLVLYTAGSYSRRSAKAKYAQPSRLAFVDADEGADISKVPSPSRRVASSPKGQHWFYILSRFVPPDELQSINKALTVTAGGDHGHSPAKKFRLPGFPNLKYEEFPIVRVIDTNSSTLDVDAYLQKSASLPPQKTPRNLSTKGQKIRSPLEATAIVRRVWPKLDKITRSRLRQKKVFPEIKLLSGDRTYKIPKDDRSAILWGLGTAFRSAGATQDEIATVLQSTIFWESRVGDGKAENIDRLVEKFFETDGSSTNDKKNSPLALDASIWAGLPVPIRQWVIEDWIPLFKVTLIYGDGGTGKTLLVLMLAVACALGRKFLNFKVTSGRVYAFLGENDNDDTHITLHPICRHYGAKFEDLHNKLHIASRAGLNNVLMSFRNGDGKHTELFNQLLREIIEFDPILVILETAADMFDGNENARNEAQRFVTECLGRIAIEAKCAVVLCAHPSVAGIQTGEGTSGSTAWSNAARSRTYLRRVIAEGVEQDPNARILDLKKTNFAKLGQTLNLTWKEGVFVVLDSHENHQTIRTLERKLISEIEQAFERRIPWSAHHQGGMRFIIPWIMKNLKQSRSLATEMLRRLMAQGEIVEIGYDTHSHKRGLATKSQQQRNKNPN